jgi:hypothetical protein
MLKENYQAYTLRDLLSAVPRKWLGAEEESRGPDIPVFDLCMIVRGQPWVTSYEWSQ